MDDAFSPTQINRLGRHSTTYLTCISIYFSSSPWTSLESQTQTACKTTCKAENGNISLNKINIYYRSRNQMKCIFPERIYNHNYKKYRKNVDKCNRMPSIASCPARPRPALSAGCGWHCVRQTAAPRCSSMCWAPGCGTARGGSPAAAPPPGTPVPSHPPPYDPTTTSCRRWKTFDGL